MEYVRWELLSKYHGNIVSRAYFSDEDSANMEAANRREKNPEIGYCFEVRRQVIDLSFPKRSY